MLNIKQIAKSLGVDKAIAYSSGARIIQAFTGLCSIFFIARYLTGEEQGYYYTFNSILAIQVFFELGLTGIITQYVAHEAVHLHLNASNVFEGDEKYRSRLSSLLHFCVKWYTVISVLLLFVLTGVGLVFFSHYGHGEKINWQIPWLILVVSTAIKLFQSPMSSFIQGIGKVKKMNKVMFYQQIILPASMWIGLMCGFKLYVVGISSLLSVMLWNWYVYHTDLWPIIKHIWQIKVHERVSYMKEIFPMQWRIALSWISGYFIFQLFNPVLFAAEGPVVAGQMGMTLAVLNGIQALSMSWITTKVPLFSGMIELKQYKELDRTFNRTLLQLTSICLSCLVIMFAGVWGFRVLDIVINGKNLGDRFLPYLPMLLMQLTVFVNMFTFSWATYLRCYKREPFMWQSITMGVLCMLSTLGLGKLYGLYGICIGYCFLTVCVGTPWAYWIFKTKKQEWHG